jgi:hypothetical protein
MKTD